MKNSLAWAAGIIEGESWIGTMWYQDRRHGSKGCVSVVMTDKDVLLRLKAVFQVGTFRERKTQKSHWRRQWIWRVYRQEDVVKLLNSILPLLGKRRTKAAQAVLRLIGKKDKNWRNKPRRKRTNV